MGVEGPSSGMKSGVLVFSAVGRLAANAPISWTRPVGAVRMPTTMTGMRMLDAGGCGVVVPVAGSEVDDVGSDVAGGTSEVADGTGGGSGEVFGSAATVLAGKRCLKMRNQQ